MVFNINKYREATTAIENEKIIMNKYKQKQKTN